MSDDLDYEVTAEDESRNRPQRKTTYERIRETEIPVDLIEAFKKDNWGLRFVRFSVAGEPDLRHLARREREGYEFVTEKELQQYGFDWYLDGFRIEETRSRNGLLVSGDVVLMKADLGLLESRAQALAAENQARYEAADVFTMIKKHGFRDLGSKSKVTHSEPGFQD
jgi:hypothetical protein